MDPAAAATADGLIGEVCCYERGDDIEVRLKKGEDKKQLIPTRLQLAMALSLLMVLAAAIAGFNDSEGQNSRSSKSRTTTSWNWERRHLAVRASFASVHAFHWTFLGKGLGSFQPRGAKPQFHGSKATLVLYKQTNVTLYTAPVGYTSQLILYR